MRIDDVFREDVAVVEKRGVHLDLKGLPPTPQRMAELLKLFAVMRYNVVLVEWEDSFPWTVDERFRSPTAYSPDDIRLFVETAAELELELVPLVQCLGHMETPLSVEGYENLREIPDSEQSINPLAEGARELVQNMVDDVLKLMPDVKHFHLGGDEAWGFGSHPDTKAFIEEHGKGALYLHHVEPIMETLNQKGIRPILWHDMMIEWKDEDLWSLAKKCDLMPWGYQGHPDTTKSHFKTEYIKRFHENGFTLWGGAAYKGAEGYDSDLPDVALHAENAKGWVEVGQRFDFVGVVATAWSRYAVDTLQCNPIDSSLDSMFNVAVILHDGEEPEGGVEACIEALAQVGEKERFQKCRDVMSRLAKFRRRGWDHAQHARQVLVLARIDKRRVSAKNTKNGMKTLVHLGSVVKRCDELAVEVRAAFKGLIEDVWMDEYLATRIEPLREEYEQITASLNQLG